MNARVEGDDGDDDRSEIIGAARPFLIALDYDDTFTSCKKTWTTVIAVLRAAGCEVICVTFRDAVTMPVEDFPGTVIYTDGAPKARFLWEQHKLRPRVWIDDQPWLIGEDPLRGELAGKLALALKMRRAG